MPQFEAELEADLGVDFCADLEVALEISRHHSEDDFDKQMEADFLRQHLEVDFYCQILDAGQLFEAAFFQVGTVAGLSYWEHFEAALEVALEAELLPHFEAALEAAFFQVDSLT